MNYKDYLKIMQEENLRESLLVNIFLDEAKTQQRYLKSLRKHRLNNYDGIPLIVLRKDIAILEAIDTARHEKMLGYRIVEDGELLAMRHALLKAKERRNKIKDTKKEG